MTDDLAAAKKLAKKIGMEVRPGVEGTLDLWAGSERILGEINLADMTHFLHNAAVTRGVTE